MHKDAQHNEEPSNTCSMSSKVFTLKAQLKSHLLKHVNARIYLSDFYCFFSAHACCGSYVGESRTVLDNDAWSQKGHSASNTTVIHKITFHYNYILSS